MRAFTIPLAGFLLLLAVACGGGNDSGDPAVVGSSGVQNGTATPVRGQHFEHLEGRLPDAFPTDFPVYADVTIHRGDTIDNRFAIDMRADVPMEDVVNFYRQQLAAAPWSITSDKADPSSVIFDFKVTDGRPYRGQVAVAKLQDLTWILIAMTFEQ